MLVEVSQSVIKSKFEGKLSYFIMIFSEMVAMINFLHFPPTFKSAIIINMNLKFLVFYIEDYFCVMSLKVERVKSLFNVTESPNRKK